MDKLWWNHIIRAHKFLEDIVQSAVEKRSMILSLPKNVPWRNTLLELVEEQLKLETPKNAFENICCPEEVEVGLFLLNKYCAEERRATYRYGMTYAAFLGKCEDTVLNDRYIWVHDIPKNKYDEWIDFIIEYDKNVTEKTPAIFILETNDENFANKARKGIRKIIFDQNIGSYDKFAFCALATTNNVCKEYMRPYLAELISSICNEDIELCAECINAGDLFLDDPTGVIANIISTKCRSDDNTYSFSKTNEEIERLIWETQLKNVFPIIEKYRSYFIKKYHKYIKNALPITNSYGESVINPEDVEIGTLIYMVRNETISLNSIEYEELNKFRDARNKLAHLNVLDLQMVEMTMQWANSL